MLEYAKGDRKTQLKNKKCISDWELASCSLVHAGHHIWLFVTPWAVTGSSLHGVFQAQILEHCHFSRESSQPRGWNCISCISCIGRWILYYQHHLRSLLNSYSSESESHSVLSNSLWPHGLYSPWSSPGQNTGVDSLSLLQGIFPTQGLNPGILHCR